MIQRGSKHRISVSVTFCASFVPWTPCLFSATVDAIRTPVAGLGILFEVAEGMHKVWLKAREHVFPNPDQVLAAQVVVHPTPICLGPGILDGENILVDDHGQVALTNFGEAGPAPLSSAFVELEAAIRFDWNEEEDFSRLHETNQLLLGANFSRVPITEAEASIRKTLRAVLLIRRSAEMLLKGDRTRWNTGILFEIARRLATFPNGARMVGPSIVRRAHLLLAAGSISKAISERF